jgi:hypothetical protein
MTRVAIIGNVMTNNAFLLEAVPPDPVSLDQTESLMTVSLQLVTVVVDSTIPLTRNAPILGSQNRQQRCMLLVRGQRQRLIIRLLTVMSRQPAHVTKSRTFVILWGTPRRKDLLRCAATWKKFPALSIPQQCQILILLDHSTVQMVHCTTTTLTIVHSQKDVQSQSTLAVLYTPPSVLLDSDQTAQTLLRLQVESNRTLL